MTDVITPDQVRHNDFTANLGTDWIAVDRNGHILSRATDEKSVRQAAPTAAAYFNGEHLKASKPNVFQRTETAVKTEANKIWGALGSKPRPVTLPNGQPFRTGQLSQRKTPPVIPATPPVTNAKSASTSPPATPVGIEVNKISGPTTPISFQLFGAPKTDTDPSAVA